MPVSDSAAPPAKGLTPSRPNPDHARRHWRSLDELANTEAFQEWLTREFPRGAAEWQQTLSRRSFLKVMGASLALAGLTACTSQPREQIAPYVRQPENIVPGTPQYYATSLALAGLGMGVLVESHQGRPTKVEGNPGHPASLGATDIFAQAEVLTLYDPDRSRIPLYAGTPSTWGDFLRAIEPVLQEQRAREGAGLHILTETVTSPTLAAQMRMLQEQFPQATWHQYEPVNDDHATEGARRAFGQVVATRYDVSRADVIFSLDADLLAPSPGTLRYAREFAARRRVGEEQAEMNRLYVAESFPSITGATADHRLPLSPALVEHAAHAIAQQLGIETGVALALSEEQRAWLAAAARDLQEHRGTCLVVAGQRQPPAVHALAHAINAALENVGATVFYTEPVVANPTNQTESLRELTQAMAAGDVEALFIVGGNPAYAAPADLPFVALLEEVPFSAHLSLWFDETSAQCTWHLNAAHALESWSDTRAFDGTVSLVQPLIIPLYEGKTAHEMLAALLGNTTATSLQIVQNFWREQYNGDNFQLFWRAALAEGLVPDTAAPLADVSLQPQTWQEAAPPEADALTLAFLPDPTIWDGRYANNAWLQELPKPIILLTWDNAAWLSPATAARLGLTSEDVVTLRYAGHTLDAAVWVVPGHAEDTISLSLGYGRTQAGQVGTGLGFNAYALRTSDAPWFGAGLELWPTGGRYALATTQDHHSMEVRELVRVGTLAQFRDNPDFLHEGAHEHESLFETKDYPRAWGMSINLNACIGCGACTMACQAENNIPVVGKEQVAMGREMHWIRVDRYFAGGLERPAIYHQPVPCMHCELAPCELVCPVAATLHDAYNGLNAMIYNRCVGTRYCSNNCPYKVRRFNFLHYVDDDVPVLKMQRNPDVTVRAQGVMEKCTYCVQRINHARIEADTEDHPLRDGAVQTACQQVCPTQAIVFGDLNDPDSEAARLREAPLNYGILTELNTKPRTTYMARLHNPNPALEPAAPEEESEA
jgi:molybdopterin-containing oxidoreductase family iron-sulfur binding subunit